MDVVDEQPQDPSQQIPPAPPPPGASGQAVIPAPQGPVTRLSKVAGLVVGLTGLAATAFGGWAIVDSASAGSYAWLVQMIGFGILAIGLPALLAGVGILRGAGWGRGIGIFYSLSLGLVAFAWTMGNGFGTATPRLAPPTAADSRSGAFAFAGMTRQLEMTGGPSWYETSFVTETCNQCPVLSAFYVSYQLAPGIAGKVSLATTSPDGRTTADSLDDPGSPHWGYFDIGFRSFGYKHGFPLGDYKAVLTFKPTGESVTLPFKIMEPAPPSLPERVAANFSTLLFGLTFVLFYAYSAVVLLFRWRRPATP